ncbi:protein of unknown function DUF523 [Desulfotomaculum nigrificans CO-1-SRB]|uniref:Uncharacterized protein n=1 Tax=Desulfotomaculum nigrificans (strain DSM 14880 / VKM B-2319 / CO-1-SRB) TaxID=868595 RepID=F6B3I2_DESCC|nr:DUF523 domain-containing protein [Desulfotomaculum nigrificans]AEF94011.1 protein of unknown function DUF523 [Desulfotomaculum nigrificans CO-1-SRB]
MILVSACLLGIRAKYDGGDNTVNKLVNLCATGKVIPVCPEQLGGLTTPRPAAEIKGGSGADVLKGMARVYNKEGVDVTESFIIGAQEILKICRLYSVKAAILKERSPSCGCNMIYDGTFQSVRLPGQGVAAALLAANAIPVYSEEELTDELLAHLVKG